MFAEAHSIWARIQPLPKRPSNSATSTGPSTLGKIKAYYRKALRAFKQEHKCLGAKPDYQANSASAARNAKEDAEQKARDEIAANMSRSFDALASAAVAKAETINSHAATIVALTKTSPPGFPPNVPAAPTNPSGNGKANGGFELRLGAELGSPLGRDEGCSARPIEFDVYIRP